MYCLAPMHQSMCLRHLQLVSKRLPQSVLPSIFFQEALFKSQSGPRGRSIFFGSVGNNLLTAHQCYSYPALHITSVQTLLSLLGSRKVWDLTTLRKHVLQAKRSVGQRHHVHVRLSSQHNCCFPYICWCFDICEVGKNFKGITKPAKIQE